MDEDELVLLEELTPLERAAYLLHDVFGYTFTDVAEITGRTPAACRQLASSARRRTRAARRGSVLLHCRHCLRSN